MQIIVPNAPIVFADTEPTLPQSGWLPTDWKWFNTTDLRWYDYDAGWVRQGSEPLSGEFEGTIKKIKVEYGLVTEVEVL